MENILENLNKQAEEMNEMVDKIEMEKELAPAMISFAAYERQTELADRREARFHKLIKWMAILWFASIVGIVAGFLIYLNQFDYAGCSQAIDSSNGGDALINDGIHISEYLEDINSDKE